jgi:predicted alpha/beta-fold hydrolase
VLRDDYFCPVVPRECDLIAQILRDLHASSLGGHLGFLKLYKIVQKRFYWQDMRGDIDRFCRQCVVC